MANALRGEASFEAGGTVYTLRMDFNALCEAEDALDLPIDVILAQYAAGTSVKLVRALVWAGLQAKHPCSIEQAGSLISEAGFLVAKQAMEGALQNAMPEAPADENPPSPGQAGTGSSSSKHGQKPASTRNPSGAKHPGS